jgi:hypothetical protein
MSSQVDGHDEERELRSFGYEQQLSRSMGERVARPLAQAAGLTDPDDRLLKAVIRP